MGLAGEKKRMKLSHDPNNTRWTNDNSSFGLKIMTSQGWQPGEYLGAKDAAHAEFHTAANASHIRVSIKDDNLGLGAKIGTGVGHGECTGLDAFKNLLGRLNGKDEDEIVKEQQSRDDLRRAIYTERKWGTQRFVSGGFLIGDKIQILIDAEAERIRKLALGDNEDSSSDSSSSDSEEEAAPVEKTKKSKKRKLEVLEEAEPEVVAFKVKKSKKSKKERKVQDVADEESAPSEEEEAAKKSKKSKKDRKSKAEAGDAEEEVDAKQRKKEKKDKKERKRREKEGSEVEETEKEKRKREKKAKREKKKAAADEDTPEASDASIPTTKESTPSIVRANPMMQGRHAVRSRYIAQKRLASMDAASLNQIFMIKSQ